MRGVAAGWFADLMDLGAYRPVLANRDTRTALLLGFFIRVPMWAGAVDNLGGNVLAWMASTTKVNGVIASIGLALSPNLTTTVMPFILRGVSLLGINSSDSPSPQLRAEAWRRLASDMRPPMLNDIARTISFDELPSVFDRFIDARVRGRIVVRIGS